MKTFLTIILLTFSVQLMLPQEITIKSEFEHYIKENGIEGSFSVYDLKNDKYILSSADQFRQEFIPASTFKICNSLIGLETGVIADENFMLKWDGKLRDNLNWDKDNTLASAFKYSTVWYYQELARRVGEEKMKYWITKARYGNGNIGGGIDMFWLNGDLRITPEKQILFIKDLYLNKLPFSQRSMDIVKKIMIAKQTDKYTLRGKTGWAILEDTSASALNNIGWYVGYVEKEDNTYFFATCVQADEAHTGNFKNIRIDLTIKMLKELGIIVE